MKNFFSHHEDQIAPARWFATLLYCLTVAHIVVAATIISTASPIPGCLVHLYYYIIIDRSVALQLEAGWGQASKDSESFGEELWQGTEKRGAVKELHLIRFLKRRISFCSVFLQDVARRIGRRSGNPGQPSGPSGAAILHGYDRLAICPMSHIKPQSMRKMGLYTLHNTHHCLAISQATNSNSSLTFRKRKPLSRINIPRKPFENRVARRGNGRTGVELETGPSEELRLGMKRIRR